MVLAYLERITRGGIESARVLTFIETVLVNNCARLHAVQGAQYLVNPQIA